MKGPVTDSSAPMQDNLGVGIQQHVWHWEMFVMGLLIAHSKKMSHFVIYIQENVHCIVLVSYCKCAPHS